ncbi:MAG: cytochrome C [Candidatus Bipolaricaulia bacterium]
MIPAHLESYQIALIVWGFVIALYGVQGLLSVWLEGQQLRPGEKGSAREPLGAAVAIAFLTGLVLFFAVRFVQSLRQQPDPQRLALYGALLFFGLAAMLVVYRKYFIGDEVITQDRDDGVPW